MAALSHSIPCRTGGHFLIASCTPEEVFTREDLSAAQQMIGSVAEDFMRTEVFPRSEQSNAKDPCATHNILRKAGELDLLSLDVPEEYGGLGLDKVSSAHVFEKIGTAPWVGVPIMAHTGIGTLPIVYFGTEQQKSCYLPLLASGKKIGAYALTEPGAGSDALSIRTNAKLTDDGRHYILNGQKVFITNGGIADVFTIFAKLDGEKFTAFIVEREMGVVSGREEAKLGLEGSSTTALFLDNVRVPVENVLGEVGQGHKVAFNILNFGRLKLATLNLGGARHAFNDALAYALERQQFGRAIATFGMIQQKLSEMAIRCYVGDAMAYRTVGDIDRALHGVANHRPSATLTVIENFSAECSMNKVFSSEALAYVVDESLQTHGGYGYSKDYPAERAYRDARIARIYEGTNEINRILIPIRLLRLPAVAEAANFTAVAVDQGAPSFHDPLFSREYELLAYAKKFVVLALGFAARTYGKQLQDEQEVLAYLSDAVMQTYALESALLRTSKLVAANSGHNSSAAIDIARIFASDAADRVLYSGKQIIAALSAAENTVPLQEAASQLSLYPAFNTVAARRRVADVLIKSGRYPF